MNLFIALIGLLISSAKSQYCGDYIVPFKDKYECYGQQKLFELNNSPVFSVKKKGSNPPKIAMLKKSECNTDKQKSNILYEFSLLKDINHPNILNAVSDEVKTHTKMGYTSCVVIIEIAERGDLIYAIVNTHELDSYDDKAKLDLFFQMVKGVKALHDRGLVHTDLKLDNFVLNNQNQIKITNFDLASLGTNTRSLFEGTLPYLDPYVYFNGFATDSYSYGYYVDIHALGVILFGLKALKLPFSYEKRKNLIKNWMKGDYTMPKCQVDIAYLIFSLMAYEIQSRPTLDQLLEWIVFIYRNIDERINKIPPGTVFNHKSIFPQLSLITKKSSINPNLFVSLRDSDLLKTDPELKAFIKNQSTNELINWTPYSIQELTGQISNLPKIALETIKPISILPSQMRNDPIDIEDYNEEDDEENTSDQESSKLGRLGNVFMRGMTKLVPKCLKPKVLDDSKIRRIAV